MMGELPTAALQANPRELAARLQSRLPVEGTEECLEELRKVVSCRYSFLRMPILRPAENTLDLGFGSFESKNLTKNLTGCEEAFLFAVTLGVGVDRLLTRLSALSPARHFITDALASALAEAACEEAEQRIKGELCCAPRFSPGYGDVSLELQAPLLNLLQGQKLGITLNQNLLMVPTKSITAIMGIKQ
ncbi:MAG: Vitamin B12 dependent methionine synthase activation subunit [Clostridia bacterium]|nr:Vitamin B12 dependent methionine synthase activation subunit [Clostridia bacterium]